MNTYETSKGERYSKGKIDRNIRYAKAQKLKEFKNANGYYFCEDCKTSQGYIDCSHDISVYECQNSRRTELAWDVNNITLRCRDCHRKHDKS